MSTGTGEREARARKQAWQFLNVGVSLVGAEGESLGRTLSAHAETMLCDRIAEFILSTDAELRRVEGAGACDACGGEGRPVSELQCMCGGTGLARDAVVRLRSDLVNADRSLRRSQAKADANMKLFRAQTAQRERDRITLTRERDEAREAIAVVREQALREALALIRARRASWHRERQTSTIVVRAEECGWFIAQLEALAARPDVAPAGKKRE